jgi:osmoprotectant transport system substrate-binding protein
MRRSRIGVVGAMVAAGALLLAACGSSSNNASGGDTSTTAKAATTASAGSCASFHGTDSLTVGSTNFSEQEIVAELYSQCLSAAGFKVTKKFKLGAREAVLPALQNGDISLYPEYVGSLLTFLKGTPTTDSAATLAALKTALTAKGIDVLKPAPAEDKNGFAVTKATATKYKLTKLSDLAPVAKDLILGGPPECDTRPLCAVGLKATYGLTFKEIKKLDVGGPLTKDALEGGQIDVGLILTSDGAIAARGFVLLQDDKNLQPPDNLVPVVRTAADKGDIAALLDSISAKLTTADLSAMNKKVDIDKADPSAVATTWLQDNGFVKK